MDRSSIKNLLQKLEGLDWFIFSGAAVKIYADPDREVDDIDLVVREGDIDRFAERLGADVKRRDFIKSGNHVEDRGFVTSFDGIEVEATSGFPEKRMKEETFDRLFDESRRKSFRGFEVNVVPPEELIVHKAKMGRDKDFQDLKSLSALKIDREMVEQLLEDWGLPEKKIMALLREAGFGL